MSKNLTPSLKDLGISILIPTRGRPENMKRVAESAISLAYWDERVQVVFYIDSDDQASIDMAKKLQYECPFNPYYDIETIDYIIGERVVLSQMWNEAYKKASYNIIMHGGDDIIFRTQDWDLKIYEGFEKYPDRICLIGGNDGSGPDVHDKKFFTHGFVHRNWIKATDNVLFHCHYSSDYNDTYLNDVAKSIGRWHWVDILTEHMHPAFGKGPLDQTHQDRIVRHRRDNVAQLYDNDHYKRVELAEKLQKFIGEYK